MFSVIWSSSDASEILFLIAAIVAIVDAVVVGLRGSPEAALFPAALALVALGLLAL